ncbi:hypothetical protein HYU11_05570 [Candidatus Woesearchaeota archaeon]|nr:hypothetical protein [Candidatus Woesearchaeota archaeon]
MARKFKKGQVGLFSVFKDELKEGFRALAGTVNFMAHEAFHKGERVFLRLLFSYFSLLSGIIFVSIAVVLLVSEYFDMGRGWGFLVIGLFFVVFGLLLRLRLLG